MSSDQKPAQIEEFTCPECGDRMTFNDGYQININDDFIRENKLDRNLKHLKEDYPDGKPRCPNCDISTHYRRKSVESRIKAHPEVAHPIFYVIGAVIVVALLWLFFHFAIGDGYNCGDPIDCIPEEPNLLG